MRLASYNVENLFDRAVAMNLPWKEGKPILDAYAKFNTLVAKPVYTAANRAAMLKILGDFDLLASPDSKYFTLRENRGHLLKRKTKTAPAEIVATGRAAWTGWLELRRGHVNTAAIANTARIIRELDADVLGVVEAEDRPGLRRFNDLVLASADVGGVPLDSVMLIDGNDERGIDVGIATRAGHPITAIRSHCDDRGADGKRIFSRDCASYLVGTPNGASVWVLVNHLKSKGYGVQAASDAKRLAQAARVREIYDDVVKTSPLVAVIGDFNDTPSSAALAPLLGAGSPLKDVSTGPNFDDGGRPGTYANGTKGDKIDYILCSPALFAAMTKGGVNRRGVWGGKNGTLFEHLPSIRTEAEAASDHAAIWADFAV